MAAILLGALLHATWNALIRAGSDKMLNTLLIVAGAGLVTACFLPFVPAPAPASWPYLAASIVIHVVYFYFVAISYRGAELSFVYPIMRGAAPAVSAVAVVFVLNESPSPLGWAGVLIVCSSIALLAADSWRTGTLRFAPTAMTHAPIALVAALRETSVVFGTIIAATFLHENVGPMRYLAILGVTAGAIAIKLS